VTVPPNQPPPAPPEALPALPEALPPYRGRPTREYRAGWTFAIAAAFGAMLLLLYSGILAGLPTTAVVGAVLQVVVAAIEALGLRGRAAWARYAMTPLLALFLAVGLLQFFLALSSGGLSIPIGALLAGWALLAKPSEELGPVPASAPGLLLVLAGIGSSLLSVI
jgi:lysylphosphatidylglycerol synthetase-like protein (DUF2156 family)